MHYKDIDFIILLYKYKRCQETVFCKVDLSFIMAILKLYIN